jgi:hypothetical protein
MHTWSWSCRRGRQKDAPRSLRGLLFLMRSHPVTSGSSVYLAIAAAAVPHAVSALGKAHVDRGHAASRIAAASISSVRSCTHSATLIARIAAPMSDSALRGHDVRYPLCRVRAERSGSGSHRLNRLDRPSGIVRRSNAQRLRVTWLRVCRLRVHSAARRRGPACLGNARDQKQHSANQNNNPFHTTDSICWRQTKTTSVPWSNYMALLLRWKPPAPIEAPA